MKAKYKHDLSDISKGTLQVLKEMGACMPGLNECLMSEKTIYGK